MLGRRKTIFLGSSIMVIGATLQCTSFSLPQFIVGRLVTGYVLLSPGFDATSLSRIYRSIQVDYLS